MGVCIHSVRTLHFTKSARTRNKIQTSHKTQVPHTAWYHPSPPLQPIAYDSPFHLPSWKTPNTSCSLWTRCSSPPFSYLGSKLKQFDPWPLYLRKPPSERRDNKSLPPSVWELNLQLTSLHCLPGNLISWDVNSITKQHYPGYRRPLTGMLHLAWEGLSTDYRPDGMPCLGPHFSVVRCSLQRFWGLCLWSCDKRYWLLWHRHLLSQDRATPAQGGVISLHWSDAARTTEEEEHLVLP